MKRRKKSDRVKLKEALINLAKFIAKERDNWTCQWCGLDVGHRSPYQAHGSHIIPVSACGRLAVDPENIKCLCARCHMRWHQDPVEADRWITDKWPARIAGLRRKKIDNQGKGTITITEYREIEKMLEQSY